jgi:hypothetical protein
LLRQLLSTEPTRISRSAELQLPAFLLHFYRGAVAQKSGLLAAIQKEIHRHDFSYFVDESPSVAQGGKSVVVSGCLPNDAMPALIDRLAVANRS